MNLVNKTLFLWKRPCVIVVSGNGRSCAAEAIFQGLKNNFEVRKVSKLPLIKSRKEILIFESDLSDIKELIFFLQESNLPVLVATQTGDIPPDRYFFAGERKDVSQIRKLARILPRRGYLILNFDDETVREIKNESPARSLTYGFQKGANFQAGDVRISINGTNFKLDHEGRIVPFWIKGAFGKEQIYSVLAAVSAGVVKGINLVALFQSLNSYSSLPGKMNLINGINNSLVLDNSKNSSVFSIIEAFDILGQIGEARKIAVLGDVSGNTRYLASAYQTIGEKAADNSNLLFAVGSQAKFIAQAAKSKGMKEESIFEFDSAEEAKAALKKTAGKGDLILFQ